MSIAFYAGATLMTALAGVIVFFLPRRWRHGVRGESPIDWLRLRQSELDESAERDRDELLQDAELRVLDEIEGLVDAPFDAKQAPSGGQTNSHSPELTRRLGLFVAGVLVVGPWLLYQALGALDDVHIAYQLDNLSEADPGTIPVLIEQIEARVAARPKNSDYLSLLGEYYTAQERHSDALRVYSQLLDLFPEAPEVLARAAQADYLSRGRVLSATAKRWAESALAGDPDQRTALGTLGMAAFESKDYSTALVHWQRLLRFEEPGSPGYEMMASVIAEAKRRVDAGVRGSDTTQEANDASTEIGITVSVRAPEGADIAPSASIFVIARPAGSTQRMPTAVVKRPAATLPFSVRLDDRQAMAGQQISALDAVDVEVQVNPSGQPGRSQATWLGQAVNVKPSSDATVAITLDPVSP